MTVAEMKSMRLPEGEQHNLTPGDAMRLRIKEVKRWFGRDKDHASITLEDASGEWISAVVFGAPSEISKMEGEWVPIEPAAGSRSGVWLETDSFVAKNGPQAGQTMTKTELKIMGNCFRWDRASDPSPAPAQGSPSPPPTGGSGWMTEREYFAWYWSAWDRVEQSEPIQRAIQRGEPVARTIAAIVTGIWMSRPPQEQNIRMDWVPGGAPSGSTRPPSQPQGGGSANDPADHDDIPFAWFFVPLIGALLVGGVV